MTQPPPSALTDPGLVLVRPGSPGPLGREEGLDHECQTYRRQLVMMRAAAQRKDRCLSAPATIKGAAFSKVSAKLVKLGLAREIEAKPGAAIWRAMTLDKVTRSIDGAGLKAIAVYEGSQDAIEPGEAPSRSRRMASARTKAVSRPG